MNTSEFFEQLDPTSRAVSAWRLGLASGSPRFLSARATAEAGSASVARRARDAGGYVLLQRLIERGGQALQRNPGFEGEAARLRGWFPLVETADEWSLPDDLLVAMLPIAESEIFSAMTLVNRLSLPKRSKLAIQLGVGADGRGAEVLRRVAKAVAETKPEPGVRKLAEATARLARIRSQEIQDLDVRLEQGAVVFTLRLTEDRTVEVVSRETAILLGVKLVDELPPRPKVAAPARPAQARLPLSVRVGAVVSFSSVRSADEALREPDFREYVLYRVDEKNVLLRAEIAPEIAMRLLQRMGFAMSELAVGN
jgi:hypothetical protein